jgi:SAM-dependent methyltransferase
VTEDGPAGDPVISRYSALARTVMAGGTVTDGDPDGGGCFGAAAYADAEWAGLPESVLQASLGCGDPLAVASLQPGETVLDLGSGGGLDVVLSARRVGPSGTAYGLDASADMLELAQTAAAEAGVANAVFLSGRIEDIPLPDEHVDVVISNCVINLSADKPQVLAEAFRVLRPGGRLGITDVIADDDTDPARRAESQRCTGCGPVLTEREYRDLLQTAGFSRMSVSPTSDAGEGLRSAIVQAVKPYEQ